MGSGLQSHFLVQPNHCVEVALGCVVVGVVTTFILLRLQPVLRSIGECLDITALKTYTYTLFWLRWNSFHLHTHHRGILQSLMRGGGQECPT